MRKLARYGWKRDIPDHRDRLRRWSAPLDMEGMVLPPHATTRDYYPEVFDQGQTSSCTGNSTVAVAMHRRKLAGQSPALMLSRLFAYYGARAMEGDASQDNGAQIRDVVRFMADTGVCREDVWPFDAEKIADQPSHEAYVAARWHRASKFEKVAQDLITLKQAIVANNPFVFGFTVYESFEGDRIAHDGVMHMPSQAEAQVGGHAVCAAAYDDDAKVFLIRNSWGPHWGQEGYFTMPYDFILSPDYCSDFWALDMMSA